jgi:predicted Zn-dependent protease
MDDRIIVLDGSKRIHKDIPLEAIREIAGLRPLEVEYHECPGFVGNLVRQAYNPQRNQVNQRAMLNALHNNSKVQESPRAGKIVLFDEDLYDTGLNWCFGGFTGVDEGLGYILISSAKIKSIEHARDLNRHEIGHMFGAPSLARERTRSAIRNLGLHCTTPGCVMQQKTDLKEAVRYASQRAKMNAPTYCGICEQNIRDYVAGE